MPNITLAVPEDLHRRMKKRSDVRWSEVARRAIVNHLEILEHAGAERPPQTSTAELRRIIAKAGVELEKIPLEKAIAHFRKMSELEWQRTSTTQAN